MSKLLYQINASFVKIEDIGNVPEGKRKNFHFMGEISGEELQGTLRGIDYALIYEGLVQAHIHEVLTTDQGEKISLERTGTQIQDENKDLVLLVGQGQARTASERLTWLNGANLTWKASIKLNGANLTWKASINQKTILAEVHLV